MPDAGRTTSNRSSGRSARRPGRKRLPREPLSPASELFQIQNRFLPCRSRSFVPACARGLEPGEVLLPHAVLVLAQKVEIVPGIDAGAVAVGKARLHRVRADRLECADLDVLPADLQR